MGLACPCTLYSSGENDSSLSPTAVRVTAGIINRDGSASGPLRFTVVAHDRPNLFSSGFFAYVSTISAVPTLGGGAELTAAPYTGGFSTLFIAGDPALHFTLVLEEFSNGEWQWRDRRRMAGRARAGTEIAAGGRADAGSREWRGLISAGPADLSVTDSSYTIRLPGLTNVSASTAVGGNLRLQIRQANAAGSYYTLENRLLSDLVLAPGDSTGEVLYSGAISPVNDPPFDDLYLAIIDPATGGTYLELDLPDASGSRSARHVDLTSIDFLADTDGDGTTDYQEILSLSDPGDPQDTPLKPVVRLLVHHSQSVADDFGGDVAAGVIHYLESTNQIYATSGIDIELELAALQPVILNEAQSMGAHLDDMSRAAGAFGNIDSQRVSTLADLAYTLKAESANDSFCGLANLIGAGTSGDMAAAGGGLENTTVGISLSTCGVTTFAHELGHMMGLTHSRPQNIAEGAVGTFPWSNGHGEAQRFHTIMSFAYPWPGAFPVGLFANPQTTCRDEDYADDRSSQGRDFARACGIDRSDPVNGADAALSLNAVGHQVAAITRDTDGDGTADLLDDDDDGDGTPDAADEAPLDALGVIDTDLDGISDPRDRDDDNDGEPDSSDAFPTDRLEQFDTDGDGIGNNADADDDGDGWTDAQELAEATDPLDAGDIPGFVTGLPIAILQAILDRGGEP